MPLIKLARITRLYPIEIFLLTKHSFKICSVFRTNQNQNTQLRWMQGNNLLPLLRQ